MSKSFDILFLGDDGTYNAMEDALRVLEDYGVEDRSLLWVRLRRPMLAAEVDTTAQHPQSAQPQSAGAWQGGARVPSLATMLASAARSVLAAVWPWKWGSA